MTALTFSFQGELRLRFFGQAGGQLRWAVDGAQHQGDDCQQLAQKKSPIEFAMKPGALSDHRAELFQTRYSDINCN